MKTIKISFRLLAAAFMLFALAFGSHAIQAENAPTSPMESLDGCPTASFSIVNNGKPAGTPISFSNESTGATSYLWDFGDGSSSTAENPTHVYEATGTFRVKLTVIGGGCTVEFIGTEDVIAL
ncbi:MAG TPA: PKD domain-containing protein [Phaeodactylibacter sp.]|nr:PKD domain-containing protein [Phaeodactylibacter sp.]